MKMIKPLLAMALLPMSVGASASYTGSGPIISILPLSNGLVLLKQDTNRTTAPGCATQPTQWALNTTTPAGQVQFAVLMAAYTSGKNISVVGTGACEVWSDTETVSYIATPA